MKYFLFLSLALLAVGCQPDDPVTPPTTPPADTPHTGITYPDTMMFGRNILTADTSMVIDSVLMGAPTYNYYSFGAELEADASLKIVMHNLSQQVPGEYAHTWLYQLEAQGWTIDGYHDSTQTFLANKSGEVIVKMMFTGHPGSCRIDYYENSATVTRSRYVAW